MSRVARRAAELSGRKAENRAAWWLRLRGWRILGKRIKTPRGEVDLVVKRGNMVAFVEVKSRKSAKDLDSAIDERRLERVAAAAEILVPQYCKNGEDCRIDVMLLAPGRLPRHLVNVWHAMN